MSPRLRSGQEKGVAEGTAVIVPTSGSTGVPKGVELSAAALLHSARASLARIGARPGERWLCCLPGHVHRRAPGAGALAGQRHGPGAGRPRRRADGRRLRLRARLPGTDPAQAPARYRHSDKYEHIRSPLAGFRSVLLGGAAAPAGLLDAARAARVPVVTTYGMTETCGGCVYDGIPLDGRASQDRRRRPHLARRPGAVLGLPPRAGPGSSHPGEHWLRTGDLGRMDSAGRLVVRGRADDVINTGGVPGGPRRGGGGAADLPGRPGRGGAGPARPGMGRTGRSGRGPGRPGRPADARIAPSACEGAPAALRCSEQGRDGRCRSHAS